jgi:membrane-associated protease RseP (regulator of RpoE activity)
MLRAVLFLILCPAVAFAEAEPHEWFLEQPFMPQRGRIGIHVQPMTPELRDYFGVSSDRGVLVTRVEEGRPAERAGVRVGDVIVAVNEEPVRRPYDLVRVLARVPRDGDAALTVVRDREEQIRPRGSIPTTGGSGSARECAREAASCATVSTTCSGA